MFDIPFEIWISFLLLSFGLTAITFARDPRAPIFMMVSGMLIFSMVALTDTITFPDGPDRSILVNTVFIAGEAGGNFTLTHMNVTTTSFQTLLFSTGNNFGGEEITASSSLIGDTVDELCINLDKDSGTASGTITIGVWVANTAQSGANALHVFGTKDINTVTTTDTEYCFTGSGPNDDYMLSSGEAVGVHYASGSGSANRLMLGIDDTNSFDSSNSYLTLVDPPSTFSDQSTRDLRMKLINNVETEETDSLEINSYDTINGEDNDFQFNEWPKILFGLYGTMLIFIGSLIYKREK